MSLPYCTLSKALADFYLSEVKYQEAVSRWGGVELVSERYKDYWLHRILEISEVVFKFGISAILGEVRYFGKADCVHHDEGVSEDGRYRCLDERYRLEDERDDLYLALGIKEKWCGERDLIYRVGLPDHSWEDRVLDITEEIYASPWWDSGFGGESWRKGVELLRNLKWAMEKRELSGLVIAMDAFVYHCHNGGRFLNKFICGNFSVDNILNAKSQGELIYLRFISGLNSCKAIYHNCYKIWEVKHEKKKEEEEGTN